MSGRWVKLDELIEVLQDMKKDPKNFYVSDGELDEILDNLQSFTDDDVKRWVESIENEGRR